MGNQFKVSIFVTCLIDQLYPDVGIQTVRLLERLGCEVIFPKSQICCGQPAFNSGYVAAAREVALNNLKAFAKSDYVVCPSGSCTAMVHHYYGELFADDNTLARQAQELAARTYELSQFIVNVLGIKDVGASFAEAVTYHPSCHGTRLLGIKNEPVELITHVEGLQIVPLENAQDCCGFGGTFAVKMSAISGAMVNEKVNNIAATKARYVVGGDMGCLMNISGSMRRRGLVITPIHLAELLNKGTESASERKQIHVSSN
jgi:L-lactate dehydrogenase complex protein LldE